MCDLCLLEKKSEWYYEDDDFVVCKCITCGIPQVVLREHSMNPPEDIKRRMEKELREVAFKIYHGQDYYVDQRQRKIPNHLHWHARRL